MDWFRQKPAPAAVAPTVFNVTVVQEVGNKPAWMQSQDGNITLVLNGRTYTIGCTHVNYEQIQAALKCKEFDGLESLINAAGTVERNLADVTVRDGQVFYKGQPIHNVVANRIIQFMQQGLPWEPLALFLSNLMQNPSARAVRELYGFLEKNQGMAITPDGCFVGYKAIRENWTDKHSGTFNNSIGKTVSIPRNTVDDNCDVGCSYGLHIGSHPYATNFASGDDRLVIVKVNPRDAVSVPKEENEQKLRACEYVVLSEVTRLIEEPLYRPEDEPETEEDVYEDEFCDGCDESLEDCVC
jgi:hypothetical protein